MYDDEQSFAEAIYDILVNFMSDSSVRSLENYWLGNKNAIETMRKIDETRAKLDTILHMSMTYFVDFTDPVRNIILEFTINPK